MAAINNFSALNLNIKAEKKRVPGHGKGGGAGFSLPSRPNSSNHFRPHVLGQIRLGWAHQLCWDLLNWQNAPINKV